MMLLSVLTGGIQINLLIATCFPYVVIIRQLSIRVELGGRVRDEHIAIAAP